MISPEFLRLDRRRWFDREELARFFVERSRAFCAGVPKKRICFADIFRRPRFAMILSRVVWAMFYPFIEWFRWFRPGSCADAG